MKQERVLTLTGLLDGNHGNLYPRAEEFADHGVPYISATCFSNNRVDYSRVKFLPEDRAQKLKKGIAKDGDVLFAHNATVGPVALLETELPRVILSTSVTYYRCNPKHVSNRFLLAYMESPFFQRQIERIMRQTTRSQVPITAQKLLWVVLPPLAEQKRIAEVLGVWDRAIEVAGKQLDLARTQKRALMQTLLTPTRRFPGYEGQPWKEVRLGDVAEIRKGTQKSKSTLEDEGDYPVINGGITASGYTDEWNTEADTITISEGGNSCGFVNRIPVRFWSGGHCYTLEDLKADKDFLYHVLKFGEADIMRLRVGSGLPNIQKKAIFGYAFGLPSVDEQKAISAVLNDALAEEVAHETQITRLQAEKKALMQQLLTGKKRLAV